jgi:hypothetical protein
MPQGVAAHVEEAEPPHTPEAASCPVAWCPICIAVGAVQPVAPELIEHLLKAGTEMFLAFRSIVEQRGDDLTGRRAAEPVRLEKIDIG